MKFLKYVGAQSVLKYISGKCNKREDISKICRCSKWSEIYYISGKCNKREEISNRWGAQSGLKYIIFQLNATKEKKFPIGRCSKWS